MYCRNCGQNVPAGQSWCGVCGIQMAAGGAANPAAGYYAPPAPPPVSWQISQQVKARSKDAWDGILLLAKSPVGGLPQSYNMFEPARALQVGVAFAVICEALFLLGAYIATSRAAGLFRVGIGNLTAGTLLKLLIAGMVPFASLAGAAALARTVFRGSGEVAGDVYTAGASMLPLGIAAFVAALLGVANLEVAGVLSVFALSYTILMLYSGSSRIAGIPEAGAAPAVPVMLIVAAWLTKVIVVAML